MSDAGTDSRLHGIATARNVWDWKSLKCVPCILCWHICVKQTTLAAYAVPKNKPGNLLLSCMQHKTFRQTQAGLVLVKHLTHTTKLLRQEDRSHGIPARPPPFGSAASASIQRCLPWSEESKPTLKNRPALFPGIAPSQHACGILRTVKWLTYLLSLQCHACINGGHVSQQTVHTAHTQPRRLRHLPLHRPGQRRKSPQQVPIQRQVRRRRLVWTPASTSSSTTAAGLPTAPLGSSGGGGSGDGGGVGQGAAEATAAPQLRRDVQVSVAESASVQARDRHQPPLQRGLRRRGGHTSHAQFEYLKGCL